MIFLNTAHRNTSIYLPSHSTSSAYICGGYYCIWSLFIRLSPGYCVTGRGRGGVGRGAIPADSSHHHRTRSSRHLGWSRPRLNIFYCAEINITSPASTAQHPALLCCFDLLSLGMYGVGMVNPDSTYFRNQHFWNIYSNILQHWIKINIISLSFPLIAIFTF